jgi:predicted house-cleaning noncanonical NTP pyrophosphatase (MazG superfamily)
MNGSGLAQPISGSVSDASVGRKAMGLLELPGAWTPSFVVVGVAEVSSIAAAGSFELQRALLAKVIGEPSIDRMMSDIDRVIVRSSAIGEGINDRGAFESVECDADSASLGASILDAIRLNKAFPGGINFEGLGLVIQRFVRPLRRGHASNERRVSRRHDSWLIEVTGLGDELIDQYRVTDRPSRISGRAGQPFAVSSEAELGEALRDVTASTSLLASRGRRHLEWIWDGFQVWIVQNDIETPHHGGPPGDGWTREAVGPPESMVTFVSAQDAIGDWQKARCVRVFAEIGLPTSELFVMENPEVLRILAKSGTPLPAGLLHDIDELCRAPVVVRSDRARTSPSRDGVLLPRTETCLQASQVVDFMRRTAEYFAAEGIGEDGFCFLVHRFIPATAGTYSLARPNIAKVRVDSTWGVPDGLLYLPHDSFEVDLRDLDATWSKLQCKHSYVDIRADGSWYERAAGSPWDWTDSIDRDDLQTVATQAALIADHVKAPVEVMHFIGPPKLSGLPSCLPWFFRETDALARIVERAPRFARARKTIRTPADLKGLESELETGAGSVKSIGLSASCEFLRDKAFVYRVGEVAIRFGLPVDLQGSVLAHVFYMLRGAGVNVRAYEHVEPPAPEPRVFDKLVRDDVPRTIENAGERAVSVRVSGEELRQLLRQKAVEESLELFAATSDDDVLAETADLLEVVEAICRAFGLSDEDVQNAMQRKREKRGGFSDGVVLKATFIPSTLPSNEKGTLFGTDALPPRSGRPVDSQGLSNRFRSFRFSRVPAIHAASGSIATVELSGFTGNVRIRNDRQYFEVDFTKGAPTELEGQLTLFGNDSSST